MMATKTEEVWILSYSDDASEAVLDQLQDVLSAHSVKPFSTALETLTPHQQTQFKPEQVVDNHDFCAVVLVIEPDISDDSPYGNCVEWCVRQVANRDDFRLFITPYKIAIQEPEDLTDALPEQCNNILGDTVQFSGREDFRRSLDEFLEKLDDIRDDAEKNRIWNTLSVNAGWLATIIQGVAAIDVLRACYLLLRWPPAFLDLASQVPLRESLAFLSGVIAFPLSLYLIALLFKPGMLYISTKRIHLGAWLLFLTFILLLISILVL